MKCYLINLERDKARLDHIGHALGALAIGFERIEAVDARRLSKETLDDFRRRRPRNGVPWEAGQIGCFLSHHAAWQKIAAGDDAQVLVLEDDIHVAPSLAGVIADENSLPAGFDIVRLETSTNRLRLGRKSPARIGGHDLRRLLSTSWCTGGYIVSRDCARKLLALPERLHDSSDRFLFCFDFPFVARDLALYQLTPAVVTQDKHLADGRLRKNFDSHIEKNTGAPHPGAAAVKSLLRHLYPPALVRSLRGYRKIPFGG